MLLGETLKNTIVKEVRLLKDVGDCTGIKITGSKGLFFEVVDWGEGMEYFIELNDIGEDGVYEPCGYYNTSSPYGDMKMLIKNIKEYVLSI